MKNGLQCKKIRGIVITLVIALACIILLIPCYTGVDMRITYDQKMPGHFSKLYFDVGNGMSEKNGIKKSLKTRKQIYEMDQQLEGVKALRYDPVENRILEPVIIHELAIYGKDGLTAVYREEELAQALLPGQDVEVISCDAGGYVLQITGEDPQIDVAKGVVAQLCNARRQNYFVRFNMVLALFAVLFCYLKWEHIKKYLKKVKYPALQIFMMFAVIFGILCYVYATYGKKYGFTGQMLVVFGTGLLALAIGTYQKSKTVLMISPEKAISFLLLCQAVCGSGLFGTKYESFETDILFYLLYIGIQMGFFLYFWTASRKSLRYVLFVAGIWVFRFSICEWGYGLTTAKSVLHTADYLGNVPGMMSFIGVAALCATMWGIFGKGIATILYALLWTIIFIGNMIEMVYHATFVKAIDLLVLADFRAIVDSYINIKVGIGLCGGLVVIIGAGYYFRKQLLSFVRPERNAAAAVLGMLFLMYTMTALDENVFLDCFEIENFNTWSQEMGIEKKQGFYAFTFINIRRFLSLIPEEPEGYSQQLIAKELQPYQKSANTDNIKPDVIYIMLESVMDPDLLTENYGVQYSTDPDATLDQYKLTTTLAATFGGLTAKSEFEGLTGMCDIFLMPGAVPYSTYFSNQSSKTYSLVDVFAQNGYETTAIHQNNRTFYNRAAAYDSFGFDRFIARDDYEETEQDYNEDNFMKCSHFLQLVIKQLEASDQPQFIWGVTIEGHSPYTKKYAQTDIKVTCDSLGENQIAEMEQYMQSVKNTDDMVKELIAYIKQRKQPTLLIVFGDHLPRLEAFDVWGTAANPDIYYATSCAAYANYKDVTMDEEYLSMNYLAPFVVHQAGIDNAPFYNYLEHLQEEMPVIRSWRMPQDGMERLKMYEMMQYDMLFGKKYFKP